MSAFLILFYFDHCMILYQEYQECYGSRNMPERKIDIQTTKSTNILKNNRARFPWSMSHREGQTDIGLLVLGTMT